MTDFVTPDGGPRFAPGSTLFDALRQKLDAMPSPGDGPDYHAEIAFWKDSVRSLLTEPPAYRLFVSDDRCTFVRVWSIGLTEVAQRDDPAHTWGPPIKLSEEST